MLVWCCEGLLAPHPTPKLDTTPCRLSAIPPMYSRLHSIIGGRLLGPQPEDASCCGNKGPCNVNCSLQKVTKYRDWEVSDSLLSVRSLMKIGEMYEYCDIIRVCIGRTDKPSSLIGFEVSELPSLHIISTCCFVVFIVLLISWCRWISLFRCYIPSSLNAKCSP
jgi:hypothetical protein